jgi:uncharacterized protein YraI
MAKKSSSVGAVIVLIALFSICGICGKCGRSENYSVSTTSPTPAVYSTPYDTSTPPDSTPVNNFAEKTEKPLKTVKAAKTATVITENANLRQNPGADAEVVRTLPEGEAVEVVMQKGAWFYVRVNNVKGWMHGNTIKYTADSASDSTVASTDDYTAPSETYSPPSYTPYSGSSYSSSYDGRPKTVSVRGYYRKNGTYVAPYMRRAPRRR